MVRVGFNFITSSPGGGHEGRRLYTNTYEMPTVPRLGEKISEVGSDDGTLLPGYVTAVTWHQVIGEWMAYVDVQTSVEYDDHTYDAT